MFKIVDRQKIASEIIGKSNVNLIYVSDMFKKYAYASFHGENLDNPDYAMFARDGEPMSFIVNDACIYGVDGKFFRPVSKKYAVRWVKNPDGLELDENGWKAVLGDESDVSDIIMPRSGFVEFTNDGLYDTDIGLPVSTVKDRGDAIMSWIKHGFDKEIAEKMVSYFMAGNNYPEARAVGKWSGASSNHGPFEIDLNLNPGYAGQNMGALVTDL